MKNYKLKETNGEIHLVKYTGKEAFLALPNGIDIIDHHAFLKCESLLYLHLSPSVKIIDTEAFYGCHNLKEVIFSEGLLEIHHRAFWFCGSITEVSFPKSVRLIGSRSFECCSKLSSITIENEGTFVDEYAFNETPYWHEMLKEAALCSPRNQVASCPETLRLPEGTTHVDIWAYSGSNIESVYLPNSLRTMGMSAFKDCKHLKEVSLTPNVYCNYNMPTAAMDGIFSGCDQLEQITIRGELINFVWDKATEPEFLKGFDREKTFIGCTKLKRLVAWKVPLSKIPLPWQRYAINGYIYDLERDKHYSSPIRKEYEEKIASIKDQLLRRTKFDQSYPLYEYLMSRHFITEENFDSILGQAVQNDATDIAASLLEYKHKHFENKNIADSLFTGLEEL